MFDAPPTAAELEALLKAGNVEEFKHVLNTRVWTNLEWHEADKLIRDVGRLNQADSKSQPNLPGLDLIENGQNPAAGIRAVLLTTPDTASANSSRHRELVAGFLPLNPHSVDAKAPSVVGDYRP